MTINNIYNVDVYKASMKLFYFSQTTVTTIGLGDLKPVANFERIFITFIFLFAVMY